MSADASTKTHSEDGQSLTAYIWPTMRSSVLISWIALQLISIATYVLFISWLKANALNSHLAASNAVISKAIDVGDWDFALNALKANANIGDIFRLTLGTTDNKIIFSGPFGASPFGFGTYCGESSTTTKVAGCIRIIALADVLNLAGFIAVSILFSFFSFFILRQRFLGTLNQVADSLTDGLEGNPSGIKEIKAVQERISNLMREREISSNQKALAELAAQVAHDIRSPLGALKIMAAKFPDAQGGQNRMVSLATQRIEDIANKLLDRHRATEPKKSISPVKIFPLVENIIKEKQVSFSGRKIDITLEPSLNGAEIYVPLDPNEFPTIISNLVNNSAESFGERDGRIQVTLRQKMNRCILMISDDGPGIPAEIIHRIGRKGFRSEKAGGSGLGLLHARTKIEEWGGNIAIQSTPEGGTAIELNLPTAPISVLPPVLPRLASDLQPTYRESGNYHD